MTTLRPTPHAYVAVGDAIGSDPTLEFKIQRVLTPRRRQRLEHQTERDNYLPPNDRSLVAMEGEMRYLLEMYKRP
jgi:hypothetical protein